MMEFNDLFQEISEKSSEKRKKFKIKSSEKIQREKVAKILREKNSEKIQREKLAKKFTLSWLSRETSMKIFLSLSSRKAEDTSILFLRSFSKSMFRLVIFAYCFEEFSTQI